MLCMYCMKDMEQTAQVCPHCGNSKSYTVPAHRLAPGTMLAHRYIVGVAKGEGGFGITYAGKDTRLDRIVAIKEYFPSGLVNRNATVSPVVTKTTEESGAEAFERGRERFLNEAKTLAKFSGELGVVHILDFFEENDTAYIVMEYLDGMSLGEYLKANGVMTPQDTITVLMPIMLSLKKIHKQGLIHRDISPSNIMVLKNTVKLIDFGAARHATGSGNKSISLMLKPGYAPEEQYRSRGVQGPWTDVYALCATIYKCITGVTPEEANDRLHCDELKTPSQLGVRVDPSFEAALMKGLSVLQQDRYQTVDELLEALTGSAMSEDPKTLVGAGSGKKPAAPEEDNRTTMVSRLSSEDNVTRFVPREQAVQQQAYRAPVQPPLFNPEGAVPFADQIFTPEKETSELDKKVADRIKKRRNKKALMVFFIIVLIVVAVLVIAVLVKNSSDKKGGSDSSTGLATDEFGNTPAGGRVSIDQESRYVNFYKTPVTVDSIKQVKNNAAVQSIYISQCELTQGAVDEIGELGDRIKTLSIEESKGFDDLTPVSKLTNLYSLSIKMCGLKNDDFKKIDTSKMPGLGYVDLTGNPDLSDISFLKGAEKSIYTLGISYTAVSDLSQIAGFEKLSRLTAEKCKISDISPLKGKRIGYLTLTDNEIKDLSPLSGNTVITNLDLASNQVESLAPLQDCTNMKNLNLNHNKLKSLAGLEKLIRLEKLECADNQISDLSGITNCTVLYYVNISQNKISDISLLSKSSEALKSLFADDNQISDLSPVSKATGLKAISFNNNKISSLDALKDCTKLSAISGDNNTIQSLEPLKNMSGLSLVSFAHNKISDMSPVEKIPSTRMYVLDLSNNNISTLALASGKTYESVLVYNNPINSLDNVKDIKGLTIAISYFEGIKLKELKQGYLKLSIVDCPLDKQVAIEKEVGRYSVSFVSAEEKEKETNEKKQTVFKQVNS